MDDTVDHRRDVREPARQDLLDPRRRRIHAHFRVATDVAATGEPQERDGRGVLEGAFALLRALPFTPVDGQVSNLSRATAIPRPTVHRLLEQLRAAGAVTRDGGRYSLSSTMLLLANLAEPVHGMREACRDILLALRDRTGATTSCVVPGGDSSYVLDVVPGRERLPVDIYAGREMPPGSSAAVVLDQAQIAPGDRRSRFSAVDREDVVPGLTCYATTFRLPSGEAAALQLSSTPRIPSETFSAVTHRAADLIEQRLLQATEPRARASPGVMTAGSHRRRSSPGGDGGPLP